MTRKDYWLVAYSLHNTRPLFTSANYERTSQWENTVHDLALEFARDNPRFRAEDFLKAAGYIRTSYGGEYPVDWSTFRFTPLMNTHTR